LGEREGNGRRGRRRQDEEGRRARRMERHIAENVERGMRRVEGEVFQEGYDIEILTK
jgi:hypothetical protein